MSKKLIPVAILLSIIPIIKPRAQVGFSSNIGTALSGGGGGGGGGVGAGACTAGLVMTAVNNGSTPTCTATITPGTITANTPFSFTQTWNNAAVAFQGLVINITPTARDAASNYFAVNNLTTGDTAFAIQPDSNGQSMFVFNNGPTAQPQSYDFAIHSGANQAIFGDGSGNAATVGVVGNYFDAGGNWSQNPHIRLGSDNINMIQDSMLTWTDSSTNPFSVKDTGLSKFAPSILRVTNGSTAGGGIAVGALAADNPQPTCDVTTRGTFWSVFGGAGVADHVQVCAKDAGDAYAWHDVF